MRFSEIDYRAIRKQRPKNKKLKLVGNESSDEISSNFSFVSSSPQVNASGIHDM